MPFAPFDASSVAGNAQDDIKELLERLFRWWMVDDSRGFADPVGARAKISQVDIGPNPNGPTRRQATVVCELDVQQDMVNGAGNLHGGCAAYLIDICTSLPMAAILESNPGVSQSINMVYHAPATVGTPLRIVSTTVAVGARVSTARGEIWDTKNARLVASGVHIKMQPSQPKL